jgi:ATP-binding cassette subfamily B protein
MKTVFRIWGLVRPYWKQLTIAYVSLLAGMALNLTIPWILRSAIDIGVTGARPEYMVTAGAIVLGIGVVNALFSLGQRYFSQWLAFRVAYDLKNRLYRHIEYLSFSFHDTAQTGQLMTRCTGDVNAVLRFASTGVLEVVSIVVMSVATVTILVIQNARLALIALAPLPVLFVLAIRFGRLVRHKYRDVMATRGKMNSILQENLMGVQVVKGFAREPHEIAKFRAQSKEVFDQRINIIRYFSINFPTMSVIVFISTALILWFGGQEVLAGRMTIGTLVAFNGYVGMLGIPARRIGFFVNQLSEAVASAERVFELLDEPIRIRSPENATVLRRLEGRVTFQEVSFRYQNSDHYVLRDLTLTAEPGQVIALLGKTGSGKTTVVNLIPRFYDVPRGRGQVLVDGVDVREVDLESLRSQIGIVLQESLLFSATIRENIAYGRQDATDKEIEAVAEAARAPLHHRIRRRVRYGGRRAGCDPLGWAAPADCHRARAAHGSAHPDPRRLDVQRGHRDRVPDPAGAQDVDGGADDVRDRPAPADADRRRPDPGPRSGTDRAARHARRAAARGRPLSRDL